MNVVSNSSPLISFSGTRQLLVLRRLFPEGIFIPRAVWDELLSGEPGKQELLTAEKEGWLKTVSVADKKNARLLQSKGLDDGEAEAIILASKKKALLLLDEHDARKEARARGIACTGTIGCLLLAKQKEQIRFIKPYLDSMMETLSFRISLPLYRTVLEKAGEAPQSSFNSS